ncbi:hypothetical protein ACFVYG_39575 [Streptomyces sp. NPDC058256]|uniref:hypothetical protein n=1 Tax=Streptomyces sp. NPDC058256 TaxID=3346408 RepID=UPI0036EBFC50
MAAEQAQRWSFSNSPAKEIVVDGWDSYESEPKTDGAPTPSRSTPSTSPSCANTRPARTRSASRWASSWKDTGKVFTKKDGSWLHPETVSETFRRILSTTDLPLITLRDLRHVAATLTHGAAVTFTP